MQPVSTEELVAYFTKRLSSDRARAIEDLSKVDAELAARLWLITATAAYCREDMISTKPAATEASHPAVAAGDLQRAEELAAAYKEPVRDAWSRPDYVPALIGRMKEGDADAARELFARYCRRLLGLARAMLRGKNLRIANEEDVVQSVFANFFRGAERGQYSQLHDDDDLWHLLVKTTTREAHKLVTEQERQKRSLGTEQHGMPLGDSGVRLRKSEAVEQIADAHLPPDCEIVANETIERLLQRLGDSRLRAIAVWKQEGYTNEEIATMLGCSSRTVERKLRRIRSIWSDEEG